MSFINYLRDHQSTFVAETINVPGLGTVESKEVLERQVRGMFNDLAKRANDPNVDWNGLRDQLENSAFHAYLEALVNVQSSEIGNPNSNE